MILYNAGKPLRACPVLWAGSFNQNIRTIPKILMEGTYNCTDVSYSTLQVEAHHKFVADHDSSLVRYNDRLREERGLLGAPAIAVKEEN